MDSFMLLTIAVLFFVYFGPCIWVLASSRSHGGAKFGWFIVTLFFSWVGLAVFFIVTQASRDRQNTEHAGN
jgi:hypothetical protein